MARKVWCYDCMADATDDEDAHADHDTVATDDSTPIDVNWF